MATYPRDAGTRNIRLDSWKEIATFFGRDARTVKRWETERDLPIHRVPGGERGGVFAYVDELELWLNASGTKTASSLAPCKEQPLNQQHDSLPGAPALEPKTVGPSCHPETDEEIAFSENSYTAAHPQKPFRHSPVLNIGMWTSAGILLFVLTASLAIHILKPRAAETASAAETRSARSRNYTPDPQAADLYLKGRYYWNMRTGPSLNQAVDYFTQSIVHDPQYAPAYAGLADCYLLLREYARMPDSEAYPRAVAAARKAAELDPGSSEAHRALAFALHYWDWDLPRAEQEFRRALQLNPNDAEAHHWYATSMLASGRYTEALQQIDEARRLQPMSISVLADRDVILLLAGRQEEAIAGLRQLETADSGFLSTHIYLTDAYLLTHDDRGYLDEMKKSAMIAKDDNIFSAIDAGRRALAKGGESAMLVAMARRIGELADRGQESEYVAASLYALAGRKQDALSYLTSSYARHEALFLSARLDPDFTNLRQDPEFQSLVARVASSARHE